MRRAVLVAALALAAGFGLGAWWAQPAPLSPRDLLSLATQLADARARQAADTYAVAREALVAQQAKPPPRSTGPIAVREEAEQQAAVARTAWETAEAQLTAQEAEAQQARDAAAQQTTAAETALARATDAETALAATRGLVTALRADRDVLAQLAAARGAALAPLRAERDALSTLTDTLRLERAALAQRLDLTAQRAALADARLDSLTGRRLRLGPAVLVGLARGPHRPWRPALAVGLALS